MKAVVDFKVAVTLYFWAELTCVSDYVISKTVVDLKSAVTLYFWAVLIVFKTMLLVKQRLTLKWHSHPAFWLCFIPPIKKIYDTMLYNSE